MQKFPTQNHQKKTTTIFRPVNTINRADGLQKQILSGKNEEDKVQNAQTD